MQMDASSGIFKHLKQLVRNIIDPTRDLGHVDRHHPKPLPDPTTSPSSSSTPKPPSSIKTTASDPTPSAASNPSSVESPKATLPQGVHGAPDPAPRASLSRSATAVPVPRDGKAVGDTSTRRKTARTTSMTGAELRLDMTL
ncbi:MAG: hypothetical protein Q9195_004473 [Heterodermia aff. obscurata]